MDIAIVTDDAPADPATTSTNATEKDMAAPATRVNRSTDLLRLFDNMHPAPSGVVFRIICRHAGRVVSLRGHVVKLAEQADRAERAGSQTRRSRRYRSARIQLVPGNQLDFRPDGTPQRIRSSKHAGHTTLLVPGSIGSTQCQSGPASFWQNRQYGPSSQESPASLVVMPVP